MKWDIETSSATILQKASQLCAVNTYDPQSKLATIKSKIRNMLSKEMKTIQLHHG